MINLDAIKGAMRRRSTPSRQVHAHCSKTIKPVCHKKPLTNFNAKALMCAEVARREGRQQRTICAFLSGCIPVSVVLFRVGDDRCCSFLMATKLNLVEQSIAPKLFTLLGDDGK